MNQIDNLSTEQELLIPDFIEKWQKIAFSTNPTDKSEISQVIKKIYRKINLPEPIIYFCDRPTNTQDVLEKIGLDSFGSQIHSQINELLFIQIENYIRTQITEELWEQLDDDLWIRNFDSKPFDSLGFIDEDISDRLYGWDSIAFYEGRMFARLIRYGLTFDYSFLLIDELSDRVLEIWNFFQIVVNNCSQIFFYENICIVYEKLKILSVDDRGLLHNDGQPALEFADGTKIYACHGYTIPEQYGKIPLDRWQVSWLLEVDLYFRDILISGIGEARICQELKIKEKINQVGVLTTQQTALISQYRKKWQNIITSTGKLNVDLVAEYINRAYRYLGEKETEIIFYDSPFVAQQYISDRNLKSHLRKPFIDNICKPSCTINPYYNHTITHPFIDHRIISELEQEFQFEDDSYTYIRRNYRHLTNPIVEQIRQKFGQVIKCIKPESFMIDSAIQDYLLSNFNCAEETERIEIFVSLMENCGWIYLYQEVCLICDRQTHIRSTYTL
ncbi:MAG: hypothetical protein AAF383_22180 [Cyanobacteria bacterium P01_A01_bin.83]